MSNRNPYRAAGTFGGPSYIERDADAHLIREICDNQRYPYFLAPRQSGKSSVIAHVIKKLDREKYQPVFVDISTFRQGDLNDYDNFLNAFATKAFSALKISQPRRPVEDLFELLEIVVGNCGGQVIIFIDEIDRLLTTFFKDTFFGQIRAAFNARAHNGEFEKIQFVLAGAAQPTELISDRNMSPFNVGELIKLSDLTLQQIAEMSNHLHFASDSNREAVCQEIYSQTHGSVYLTQLIFERLWETQVTQSLGGAKQEHVFNIVEEIIREAPDNLHFINIHSGIINNYEVLRAFRRYIRTGEVDSSSLEYLKIIGVTDAKRGYRNLIYQRVFGPGGPLALIDDVIFISYAHKDEVLWRQLEENLTVLVRQQEITDWHFRNIPTGKEWAEEVDEHINSATIILFMVSANFMASDYCHGIEVRRAIERHERGEALVIPLILQQCNWEDAPFSNLQALPRGGKAITNWSDRDAAYMDVVRGIRDAVKQLAASPLRVKEREARLFILPYARNPFFTGRSQILDELRHTLTLGGKVALSGMGGVGKTQIAVEYAYRHRSEYKAVIWVKADSEDSLKASYTAIASEFNLPEKDETDRDVVVAAVKRWLKAHTGWLLILDNADDLSLVSDLARREWGGHILLTTRAYATGNVSKVEIVEMMPEEGTLLLLRRAKLIAIDDALGAATEVDQALATEITREVGGLPLALDQSGAFIEEMSSNLAEYLDLYRKEGASLRASRAGITSDHEPATITFSLAFRQVANANVAAADMLRVCAFLAPDAIPEEVFVSGAGELGENFTAMTGGGIGLVKMIGEATRFSLIRRNAKNGTIEIHRVVQQVVKDEMDATMQRLWAERVVRALDESFPEIEYKNWPLCEKFLPHAQEAMRLIGKYAFEFFEAARLLNQTGYYCQERAQYGEAEPLQVMALNISEKVLGPEHPAVALSLNNLAALYYNQGKYAEAEPLLVRALSIREKALGPEHPDVATSINNLAALYDNQGRYAEAEPLLVRSLSIREKALGPEHPYTASSLNNLAGLYDNQGKYAEAEPLLVRALGIREKALGPEHPDVATSFNNLALLYDNQGRYAEAEPLLVRSLSIREKALGPEHPDVATSINNLAGLYKNQGRYAEAEPLLVRSLSIREKAFGPEHPYVATSLNNLAGLYDSQGNYEETEQLYVRALSIREKVFGLEHPDVALSLNNLAGLYDNQGRYAEAEPLLVRALGICERVLGPKHPSSLVIQQNYNALLQKIRNNTEE